jgi:DNA-directed RNA polymerase specialized sigma subunit
LTEDNNILEEYIPLINHIASMAITSSTVVGKDDLCRVGEVAALEALRIYDASSGASCRSFVSKIVRQEIFREAARFCGVFTVDPRTTKLAAKASKLFNDGRSDKEIAEILSSSTRTFDSDHVKDLRMAYVYNSVPVVDDCCSVSRDIDVDVFLASIPMSEEERLICNNRILKNKNAKDIALILEISLSHLYSIELTLKKKIKRAIRNHD